MKKMYSSMEAYKSVTAMMPVLASSIGELIKANTKTEPYKIPVHQSLNLERHQEWLYILENAEKLVRDDLEIQKKVKAGMLIKERAITPEVLGRLYAQYCNLINKFYEIYLHNLQMQRQNYILELISIIFKRMYELREELVYFIVNDYIYVDRALEQTLMTPFDIEIVVPYHYPKELRPDSIEQMLQLMWKNAKTKKTKKIKKPQPKPEPDDGLLATGPITLDGPPPVPAPTDDGDGEEMEEVEEEEAKEPILMRSRLSRINIQERRLMMEKALEEPSVEKVVILSDDYLNIRTIQRQERSRQFYLKRKIMKITQKLMLKLKIESSTKVFIRVRAAKFIQNIYRSFMKYKRLHLDDYKRDIILGILPDFNRWPRPLVYRDENEKLMELRRQKRKKIEKNYKERKNKEYLRLLTFKKEAVMEDITDEVMDWFEDWYYGYGFFPQYPYDTEEGTVVVVRGEYPSIEEQAEADEKYHRATAGKTKEQLRQEKEREKEDALLRQQINEDKLKKEKEALFKARCNPMTDPGYAIHQSDVPSEIANKLAHYRQAWSLYDLIASQEYAETVYGFIHSMITEDLMQDLHYEARKIVDELMRLELKLLIKAQKKKFQRLGLKWPTQRRWRKRPKEPKLIKPLIVHDEMLLGFRKLFEMGIVSKPNNKISEIVGDLKYAVYERNIDDPDTVWPNPGFGDVRRRLILSCIFGSGIEPAAPRNISVMLLGMKNNGKHFLADCVAGELNAVKFDISPEVFTAKTKSKAVKKLVLRVFQAARYFQPSVIFCRDIERVFYKKVPKEEKKEKAKALKSPLLKLLKKMIVPTEKMIFIGTCSDPFVARWRPMVRLFSEVILVPRPDYGSIQRYLYNRFHSIHGIPPDFEVGPLATVMRGFGFKAIEQIFDSVMTLERTITIYIKPFRPEEMLEYMIENDLEPISREDYNKLVEFYMQIWPLKKEREEYEVIIKTRKYVYEKLKKFAEDKQKRKKNLKTQTPA